MMAIDKLCYSSRLRYVNAGEKFTFSVLTLLLCVVSRSLPVAVVALAITAYLIVGKSGVKWRRYVRYMQVPLVFLVLSTLAIIVNLSREPMDAYAFLVNGVYVTSSWSLLYFALQLVVTALASVSCLYFLSFTTPMPDILMVLEKMRCPEMIEELMLLIYRFIFVLLDIASSIRTSQDSRLGYRNLRIGYRSFGSLCSALLIRSIKKSNVLYDAMESRCYDGKIKVLTENYPPKKREVVGITGFEVLLLAVYLVTATLV